MRLIKYIIYFLFFFTLFYLESFQVTPAITFSQLWKIPLVFFMIAYILSKKNIIRPKFNKVAYLHGAKNLFNQAIFTNPITNIIETFRFSNFPLLYDTINIYFKDTYKLQKFLIRISQYVILSSIPFLLGFLESVNEGRIKFGENPAYSGIFQNSHSASIVTTFALLVLIHQIKTYKLNFFLKIYNLLLIVLGLYALYLAFVRTGYLMFAIGIIVLFLPNRFQIRQWVVLSAIAFTLSSIFIYFMETNESFRYRILDQDKRGEQSSLGSGRLDFATYSLLYWYEGDMLQKVFGRGLDNVEDNLERKTGMRIFSHNGFVDALAINGIIGITIFITFLYLIYNNIRKNKSSSTYRLALAMFFCFLSFQATQGGAGFPIDLYMVSVLNLTNKNQIQGI